ncbi:hypothetical protein, partial [Micromonospora sp. WMMD736]|uniref:hypothetical protein n=1 Tax=Micromonospora sp. WMMD736 TaxID=3404112 RepID=UPI003B93CDD3
APQQWGGPSPGPPPGGGKGKWILGGLAAVLAIALAVVITVVLVRPDSGDESDPHNGDASSEFASAGDTGPVNIITEDPTCETWTRVSIEYADEADAVNWGGRDRSIPATAWSSEQRAMYDAVGEAQARTAEHAAKLARATPHRVMRELYNQFIAYSNLFVEAIPSYEGEDANLAIVADTIFSALSDICSSINWNSAPPIAPLIPDISPPTSLVSEMISGSPTRFLPEGNPVCSEWESLTTEYNRQVADWRKIDPQVAAPDWTPEQRSVNERVAPLMSGFADDLERLGRESGNATLEDVAVLAAQYRRAYVLALPTYRAVDNFLSQAAINLQKVVFTACDAAA